MIQINLLYLINFAGNAGTEKYVKLLIREFHQNEASGHGKDNCFLAYHIAGPLSQEMDKQGVPTFQLTMRHALDIAAAKRLADYCRKNQIDVIHAQYPRENNIAVLSRLFYRKPKVVFTCHLSNDAPLLWKHFIYPVVTRFNHKILCVCNRSREVFLSCHVKPEKLAVIFNGIEKKTASQTPYLRKELNISDDTFLMVSVARFSPEKGLSFLVNSIRRLELNRPFQLLLIGDGDLFHEISCQVEALQLTQKVQLLGFRSDVESLLPECDVFINSASSGEAFSFAILEALACSLPVIATNVGGNGDLINSKTNCGMLVEYGDQAGMANAMKQLAQDTALYNTFSQNAGKAAAEDFSLQKMFLATYQQYR